MASSDVQRKLTAIFCTDVAGYSRLMGDDPEGTLKTLTEYREVFSSKITEYKGRIVNAPGDSILAEFNSVLDALSSAVEIQRELAERNQGLSDTRRMDFRIGVNLGDVLVKDGAIYGDGVNMAARLESLADPGGICISGSVYEQVKARLPLHYEFIGEQKVKNIAEPVKAYKVLSQPGAAAHRAVRAARGAMTRTRRNWAMILALILILAAGGGYLAWQESRQDRSVQEIKIPPHSIAVMAFDNLSGDPEQEYFSDAISENLLTNFSRYKELTVIARNSSFAYKGKAMDVRQIGRELGVRHILEGSVQRSGEQLRINVQLIDTESGKHLWAERFDRKMGDVFRIQDEISDATLNLVYKLINLTSEREGAKRVERNNPRSLKSKDFVWKGWAEYWNDVGTSKWASNLRKADQLADQALALDAESVDAVILKGFSNIFLGFLSGDKKHFQVASTMSKRAIELDPHFYGSQYLSGTLYSMTRNYDRALTAFDKTLELNPNAADPMMYSSIFFARDGQLKKALAHMEKAKRLNPHPPIWYNYRIGGVYYFNGMYDKALKALKKDPRQDFSPKLRFMAAAYVKLGNLTEAKKAVKRFMAAKPKFSLESWEKRKVIRPPEMLRDYVATLRKAGFPD